jgi:hypothetical protein
LNFSEGFGYVRAFWLMGLPEHDPSKFPPVAAEPGPPPPSAQSASKVKFIFYSENRIMSSNKKVVLLNAEKFELQLIKSNDFPGWKERTGSPQFQSSAKNETGSCEGD